MATFESYKNGQPGWVDISTPDPDATKAFYTELFGWEVAEQGPEAGGYALYTLRGKNVAGVGPIMMEGQPPAWTTYINVDDADATMAKVKDGGGMVFVEPMDVLDAGRMAVLADPTGAALAIWQPNAHSGAQLANEPSTLVWNELHTRDPAKAIAFYESVFGWHPNALDMEGMTYTEWILGDAPVGGMLDMTAHDIPAEAPPHWLVYFGVEDTDAAVAQATKLGATTIVPPTDIEPGRFAVLMDPQGAVFAMIANAQS